MDKVEERDLLVKVFGKEAGRAQASERPDFLIPTWEGTATLGVEVTSAYAKDADAKLRHLPGYGRGLLKGTTQIHRADHGAFEVGKISIIAEDGTVKASGVSAIISDMPTPQEGVDLILASIAEKERKVSEYLKQCSFVDLIIEDASRGFFHKTREEFYRLFASLPLKEALIGSRFREIYLVIWAETGRQVYVPMIANAFICDLWVYVELLQPDVDAKRPEEETAQILAACMLEEGYRNAKAIERSNGGTSFFSGAWEMLFMENNNAIRDWRMFSEEYEGQPLAQLLVDAPVEIRDHGRRLHAKRHTKLATIDLRFPVQSDEPDAERASNPTS